MNEALKQLNKDFDNMNKLCELALQKSIDDEKLHRAQMTATEIKSAERMMILDNIIRIVRTIK